MTVLETPAARTARSILDDVSRMILHILDVYGLDDVDITMETTFHEDLEMESIDLVTLAGLLAERYGPEVNLAEYLADLDLEDVIELTIGDIVGYVAGRTETPEGC